MNYTLTTTFSDVNVLTVKVEHIPEILHESSELVDILYKNIINQTYPKYYTIKGLA